MPTREASTRATLATSSQAAISTVEIIGRRSDELVAAVILRTVFTKILRAVEEER